MSETKVVYVPQGTEKVVAYKVRNYTFGDYSLSRRTIAEFYTESLDVAKSYLLRPYKAGDYWDVQLVVVWRDSSGNLYDQQPIKQLPKPSIYDETSS